MATVDFSNLTRGIHSKSKYETYGDVLLSLLEEMRMKGDSRIHYHQLEAVLRANGMLIEDKGRRMKEGEPVNNKIRPVLIVSPTGSGKSGMIVLLPYVLQARKVLILTPSKNISEQLGIAFGKQSSDRNFFEVTQVIPRETQMEILEPVRMIQKGADIKDNLTNCVIVNAQKFAGQSKTTLSLLYRDEEIVQDVYTFFAQFDLLIVDEAHHYPAETWKMIVDTFSIPAPGLEKKIVFLTATPFRKGPRVEDRIPILPDLDKRIAYKITPDDLEGRYIRGATFTEEQDVDLLSEHIKTILDNQFAQESRFQPQAMIIVPNKNEAADIEAILNSKNGANYAVAIFRGRKGVDEDQLKRDFDKGHHRVAIVCGLLNEGYDNPKVTLCIILRKIRSQTLFSQFVGRCLRINRAVEGERDKTMAVVLSYRRFQQQQMWDQREELAERDPVDVDDDFFRVSMSPEAEF